MGDVLKFSIDKLNELLSEAEESSLDQETQQEVKAPKELCFNRAEVETHVKLVHKIALDSGIDGKLVVGAYTKNGKSYVKHFMPGDSGPMVDAIMAMETSHPNYNIYMPWAIMSKSLGLNCIGTKEEVVALLAAVGDLDNDKGNYPLDIIPIDPSYVVESSPGNYQPTYIFTKALTGQRADSVCQKLDAFIGEDKTYTNHLWRVPGTINYPVTQRKLDDGRVPTMASILHDYVGNLVEPEKIEALAPKRMETPDKPTSQNDDRPQETEYEKAKLDHYLSYIHAADLGYEHGNDPTKEYNYGWVHIGMILYWLGWSDGQMIYDKWASANCNPKYNSDYQRSKWKSGFKDDKPSGRLLKIGTLVGMAMERGALPFPSEREWKERQEEPQKKVVFELFNPAEFEGRVLKERNWIVPGYILSNNGALLAGDGGAGKDYLKLQLAVARAVNQPWIGLEVKPGKTLIISDEDDIDEVHRRLDGILKFYSGTPLAPDANEILRMVMAHLPSATYSDLGEFIRIVDLVGEDCVMGSLSRTSGRIVKTPVLDALEAAIEEFEPELVCMGNLANIYSGSENDRTQVTSFIRMLQKLCREHECAMLIPSHPSLSGMASGSGYSGSTGWHNAFRQRCYLEPSKKKKGIKIFKGMKNSYGPENDEIELIWKDGLLQRLESLSPADIKNEEDKAEAVFLALLHRFDKAGREVTATASRSSAPVVFSQEPDNQGLTYNELNSAMQRLFIKDKIKNVEIGTPSKSKRILKFA